MQGKWNIAYFYVEFANHTFYLKMVYFFFWYTWYNRKISIENCEWLCNYCKILSKTPPHRNATTKFFKFAKGPGYYQNAPICLILRQCGTWRVLFHYLPNLFLSLMAHFSAKLKSYLWNIKKVRKRINKDTENMKKEWKRYEKRFLEWSENFFHNT